MRDELLVCGSPLIEEAEIDEVVTALRRVLEAAGPRR